MTDTQRQLARVSLYSFGGGFADVTSYLVFKTFTGHVTGNLILVTVSLAKGEWNGVLPRVVAIACFLACTSLGFRLAQNRRASVDRFFTYAKSREDVWFARKDDIARWILEHRENTPILTNRPSSTEGLPGGRFPS